METERIWTCKIGGPVPDNLALGADHPMREVVEAGYLALTGRRPAFIFSGWGASLEERERAVVENRLPAGQPYTVQVAPEIAARLEEWSEPVQVRVIPVEGKPGELEMLFRTA